MPEAPKTADAATGQQGLSPSPPCTPCPPPSSVDPTTCTLSHILSPASGLSSTQYPHPFASSCTARPLMKRREQSRAWRAAGKRTRRRSFPLAVEVVLLLGRRLGGCQSSWGGESKPARSDQHRQHRCVVACNTPPIQPARTRRTHAQRPCQHARKRASKQASLTMPPPAAAAWPCSGKRKAARDPPAPVFVFVVITHTRWMMMKGE